MCISSWCSSRTACWAASLPNSGSIVSVGLAQRSERGAELGAEEFRLFPRRKEAAPVDLVEVDEVAIGTPGPRLRRSIDVLREYCDGHRQRDLGSPLRRRNDDAASCAVLPVKPR